MENGYSVEYYLKKKPTNLLACYSFSRKSDKGRKIGVRTLVLCIYASYGGAEGREEETLETGEFWVATNSRADSL